MNDLQVFTYGRSEVRTILRDGEPWFVLKDVCAVLGIAKYRDAATRLDPDEREPVRVDTPGGPQEMILINESGLYHILLRSDKPEAKPFRKWVTGTVLPSIRKTGAYSAGALPDSAAKAALAEADPGIPANLRPLRHRCSRGPRSPSLAGSAGGDVLGGGGGRHAGHQRQQGWPHCQRIPDEDARVRRAGVGQGPAQRKADPFLAV